MEATLKRCFQGIWSINSLFYQKHQQHNQTKIKQNLQYFHYLLHILRKQSLQCWFYQFTGFKNSLSFIIFSSFIHTQRWGLFWLIKGVCLTFIQPITTPLLTHMINAAHCYHDNTKMITTRIQT